MERRKKSGAVAVAPPPEEPRLHKLGESLVTGAADDDPSAIGTYANAGAHFGPGILWMALALFPLRAAAVYLASKLGLITGQGMAAVVREHYPRWLMWTILTAIVAGNTFEASADLGGTAAALQLVLPLPGLALGAVVAGAIAVLLWFGSYARIRAVFRWLALALFAYIGSAVLARPHWRTVLLGSFVPKFELGRDYWVTIVAMIGASLSPYLFVWQASQDVEEGIAVGRRRLSDRQGTSRAGLRHTGWASGLGMFFSSAIMYFIILSTGTVLHPRHVGQLNSAAQAAEALQPLAGTWAGGLFAAGVIGVGFLALPVMAVGAGYVFCDSLGWKNSLTAHPHEAKAFYAVILTVIGAAVAVEAAGMNPMHALVAAGVVQGFLAPVILLLLMLTTNDRRIMGAMANGRGVNTLGWVATGLVTAAAAALAILAL